MRHLTLSLVLLGLLAAGDLRPVVADRIPLAEALSAMVEQATSPKLQHALADVARDVACKCAWVELMLGKFFAQVTHVHIDTTIVFFQ